MRWVVTPSLLLAILATTAACAAPDRNLHVFFLDVGQGDAILLQRGSQQVLIDGGPSPAALTNALGHIMPFWDRTIEMVVLTHPHADHMNGLEEVINRYNIGQVVCPEFDGDSYTNSDWNKLLSDHKLKPAIASPDQQIDLGKGALIDVLSPSGPVEGSDEDIIDGGSLVLRLTLGKISFLFTSDIGEETEDALINAGTDLDCTVLKVAHHGSRYSTSTEFLAAAGPQVAVICVGKANDYGHPNAQTLDRLHDVVDPKYIFRTDVNGTVELITDGQSLRLKTSSKPASD
jgi:competence protein ComEC